MALPSAYGEESPDALRRRADVLLDEMMLGGVDTASAGPHTGNGAAYWSPSDAVGPDTEGAGYADNGVNGDFGAHYAAHDANGYHPTSPRSAPPTDPAPPSTFQGSAQPSAQQGGRLISAEERYAQLAGAAPAGQPGAASSAPPPFDAASVRPWEQPERSVAREASATAWQESTSATAAPQPAFNSAVRRQSPSLASTMSVGVRAANRSNLLPRSNEIDANAVQQEINDLLRAVGTALPAGNEAVERSRHLLNKAQTLLQSDPTRTAEVDYYLQQVRRIVQRTRQTQQWSSLYRQRLTVYLWAWLLLSALIVAAAVVFAGPIADWLNQVIDLPDWWLVVQQGPVLLAGAFAGSLGASLSALLHMQRQARREFGYFDRKYGLRGLLLPLLGWFLGSLLALLWSGAYLFASLDPVPYSWAIAAPATVALLVGFVQQWLYGAR